MQLLMVLKRYISMVAASCMVLYGYDTSVFNTVQVSTNWLTYFNFDVKKPVGDELRYRTDMWVDFWCRILRSLGPSTLPTLSEPL